MGSGNGLAGLLSEGRQPPREPDDVEGSDKRSSLRDDDPAVMPALSDGDEEDNNDEDNDSDEDTDDEDDEDATVEV